MVSEHTFATLSEQYVRESMEKRVEYFPNTNLVQLTQQNLVKHSQISDFSIMR